MKLPLLTRRTRGFWLASLALIALPLGVARWKSTHQPPLPPAPPYHFPTAELKALDDAVQARFAVVPTDNFGAMRIGERHAYFVPATAQEKEAIHGLQQARREVLFFVVARNTILVQFNGMGHSPIQGPIYFAPGKKLDAKLTNRGPEPVRFMSTQGVPDDLPNHEDMISLATKVFADPTRRNGDDLEIANWKIVARPVLASSQQCVDCHNSRSPMKSRANRGWNPFLRSSTVDVVQLNDTLGIALYAYRSAGSRPLPTRTLTKAELDGYAAYRTGH